VALKGGSVEIKTNDLYQGLLNENMSVAAVIWRGGLRGYLNQANEVMKRLLTTVLHVKETHPMIEDFVVADSPSEMTVRLKQCLDNTDDNLFKYESRYQAQHPDGARNADDGAQENECEDDESADVEALRDQFVNELVAADADNSMEDNEDVDDVQDLSGTKNIYDDIESPENVYALFLNVITADWKTLILGNGETIVKAMEAMQLDKREEDDVKKVRAFNTLLGRWFGTKAETKKVEKGIVIERGSIVALDNDGDRRFVVSCVFYLYGSKWHASKKGHDPSWLLNIKEIPRYRLSLREVFVDAMNGVELKPYEQITDGENVCQTYMVVNLAEVKRVFFKIEY